MVDKPWTNSGVQLQLQLHSYVARLAPKPLRMHANAHYTRYPCAAAAVCSYTRLYQLQLPLILIGILGLEMQSGVWLVCSKMMNLRNALNSHTPDFPNGNQPCQKDLLEDADDHLDTPAVPPRPRTFFSARNRLGKLIVCRNPRSILVLTQH